MGFVLVNGWENAVDFDIDIFGDGSWRSLGLLNLFDLHLGQAFVAFKQKIQVHGIWCWFHIKNTGTLLKPTWNLKKNPRKWRFLLEILMLTWRSRWEETTFSHVRCSPLDCGDKCPVSWQSEDEMPFLYDIWQLSHWNHWTAFVINTLCRFMCCTVFGWWLVYKPQAKCPFVKDVKGAFVWVALYCRHTS